MYVWLRYFLLNYYLIFSLLTTAIKVLWGWRCWVTAQQLGVCCSPSAVSATHHNSLRRHVPHSLPAVLQLVTALDSHFVPWHKALHWVLAGTTLGYIYYACYILVKAYRHDREPITFSRAPRCPRNILHFIPCSCELSTQEATLGILENPHVKELAAEENRVKIKVE